MAGSQWRLLGSVQRTLPSPASWMASPFFWVAKEAQHVGLVKNFNVQPSTTYALHRSERDASACMRRHQASAYTLVICTG